MNYRVRRYGTDLGIFSLDELRQRHEAGEFQGSEYVQLEGQPDWQPLDLVLAGGYRVMPPPLPGVARPRSVNPLVIGGLIAGGLLFFILIMAFLVYTVRRGYRTALEQSRVHVLNQAQPEALAAAGKPIVWSSNTLTYDDAQARAREFRVRQWLDGYKTRSRRDPALDDKIIHFIQNWIAYNYGGHAVTHPVSPAAETEELAADPHCSDPLVLAILGVNSANRADAIDRLQRALDAFSQSGHRAYPKFYAEVSLAAYFDAGSERQDSLDAAAIADFGKSLGDGSYTPSDQPELAEIFLQGWGSRFFYRNQAQLCRAVDDAGT